MHSTTILPDMMRPDLLRITVGPGSIHVARYGHGGSPCILLHGFGTCSFLWRAVAPMLADAGHTAYAIDLFGHGESDRTAGADLGNWAQAEYLDAAMTALRVARAVIVGVDVGGDVALRLALRRPDRTERLVLINTPALDQLPAGDIAALQLSTARFAFRASRGILGAAPLLQPLLEGSVATPDRMPTNLMARYLAPFAGIDGVNHLLTLAAAVREDGPGEADLAEIQTPALVVRGEADQWLPGRTAETLARTLPHGRLVTIPGVGRLVPEEAPERLVALLLDLLQPAPAPHSAY